MKRVMSVDEAMSFVREHGLVLVSAKGPVPRLVEAIAAEPIKGSWWAHPKSRAIYGVLQKVTDSPDVVTCRLVNGKLTLVHRRLWPALVKLSGSFAPGQLAHVREEHTPSGHHVTHDVPYPEWVPPEVMKEACALTEEQARTAFGSLLKS